MSFPMNFFGVFLLIWGPKINSAWLPAWQPWATPVISWLWTLSFIFLLLNYWSQKVFVMTLLEVFWYAEFISGIIFFIQSEGQVIRSGHGPI